MRDMDVELLEAIAEAVPDEPNPDMRTVPEEPKKTTRRMKK